MQARELMVNAVRRVLYVTDMWYTVGMGKIMNRLFLTGSVLLSALMGSAAPAKLLCEWHEDEGLGEMPAVPGLDGTDAFTLSVRASWSRPRSQGYPNLLSGHGWGGDGSMLLFVNDGHLSFRVGSSDGQGKNTWHESGTKILSALSNVWTTVTVTFSRPVYTVYVDGREVSRLQWDEPFRMKDFQLGGWGDGIRHDGRLDDLRVFDRALTPREVALLAAEGNWKGVPEPLKPVEPAIVLEGARTSLAFDRTGRLCSLKEKGSGRELLAEILPFLSVTRRGNRILTARRVERRGQDRLAFLFPAEAGEAVFAFEPFGRGEGWSFTLESLTVPEVEEIQMARLRPVCAKWCGTMANVLSDERSAVAVRAYDVALSMSASRGGGLLVRGAQAHGFIGMRFGLAAGPREGFVDQLRAMSEASGAPLSPSGGAWSLGAEACRESYLFADLSLASVDDWIDLAERGGLGVVHFHGWWQWLGQYPVNTNYFPRGLVDMKAAVDRVHAAGLKAGMHSLTACINPHVDPWITPVCSTNLVADAVYTLAEPVSPETTEIRVAECPIAGHDLVFTYSSNGNFLRLGNEVVQYTGVRREKPYAFTGCRRGYFKTRPMSHSAGTRCDYLHQRYIAFYPAPDSPLADDLATRLANVRNVCGIDSFYFDGSEGMRTRYGIDRLRHLIYGHFTTPPVAEASCWGAHNWWFHSRVGAWDHAVWGARRFHDAHVRSTIEDARKANFMEPQMGWWQPRVGSTQARGHFSEEMEYFAGKNAAFDAAMSQQGVNVTRGPLSEFLTRQFTLLGWYERARLARAFTDQALARLAAPRAEFRLRQGDDGVWSLTPFTSIVHRVTGNASDAWRFSIPEAATGTLRVEALYGVDRQSSSRGTNLLAAAEVPLMKVKAVGGVKAHVSPVPMSAPVCGVPRTAIRLEATNTKNSSRGAWVSASRDYEFPYLSLGNNAAFGFWVKGDGSGAILNLQLRMAREYHGSICEHYVKLDFTGWRWVELLARERDADAFADLVWPYSGAVMAVHRNPYDGRHVQSVSLWLNEIPAGGSTVVEIADLRALPIAKPVLKDAMVTINSRSMKIPFNLNAGDYAELEQGCWTHYSQQGESLARVVEKDPLRLLAGVNDCSFSGMTDAGSPVRADVTILAEGKAFPAFKSLSSDCRRKMSYEAMLPFRYAPEKGFDMTPRLAVRPGECVSLELTVHGPVVDPSLDFGEKGRFIFPVTLQAGERLECRDGLSWRVLKTPRKELAKGRLARPIPMFAEGVDWRFGSASPSQANARVEVVKRYRP